MGAREVAWLLGVGPNTKRAYRVALVAAGLLEGDVEALPSLTELREAIKEHRPSALRPPHEQSSVIAWETQIRRLVERGLTARPVFDRICLEEEGFDGTYPAVKRFIRRLQTEEGIGANDVVIPVEHAGLDLVLVAQVRDHDLVDEVATKDRGLLLGGESTALLLAHVGRSLGSVFWSHSVSRSS